MFKQKTWVLKRRSRLYLGSNEMNSSLNKFKGSLFAIIFGLIIACFVIIGSGQNAFTYFQLLLTYAFTSWPANNWDNTLVWWTIYIVAGLALVISFRSGMFNIGVAGQMLAAGAVVIAIGIRYDLSQPLAIIVALFAGVLAAILVALVTVLLKVFFNVHEVVTSILLNWTIWYLVKWLFKSSKDLYDADHGTSAAIHDSMSMSINGYNYIVPLIIAIILIITVWFLLKKTTLGYKVRTVGLNPFAAVYSGINHKYYSIISFIISGALAGVMAIIYYIAKNPSISFLTDDLPTIGFDSIAVALVGQINAIGVVGAAFLWGLIKSGGSIGSVLTLPTATGDIIFGVIIYSAACAVLLSRLQPIKFLIRYFNIVFDKEKRKVTNSFLGKMYQYFIETFKVKKQYNKKIRDLKIGLNKERTDKIKHLKAEYEKSIVKLSQTKDNQQLVIKQKDKKTDSKVKTNDDILIKKELKQKLNQKINKINNDMNLQLQAIINDKNDKVSVIWTQFFQENKALTHYIYKQYNAIWKKGKIGNWNNLQQKIKVIYAESLNTYINEKMKHETAIYNYKQDLLREVVLLKRQKAILDKSRIRDLKWNLCREIFKLRRELINEIKPLKKQIANSDDKKIKQQLILAKRQLKANYKSQVKELVKKKKIDRQQLKVQIIPINSNINILTEQFTKKVEVEKMIFTNKFNDIFKQEQQAIMQIKTQGAGGQFNGST